MLPLKTYIPNKILFHPKSYILLQINTSLKLLSSHLTDDDLASLLQKWTHKITLNRFDYLCKTGQIENRIYYINKGTFRTYSLDKGIEKDEIFGFPNDFYCSFVSLLTQEPTKNNIQALSKAEVIGINRTDFYQVILSNRKLERVWRQHTEQLLIQRVERSLLLRSTSIQKVKLLLENKAEIFQLIPNKYIASYLDMSPATLSRMLKQL